MLNTKRYRFQSVLSCMVLFSAVLVGCGGNSKSPDTQTSELIREELADYPLVYVIRNEPLRNNQPLALAAFNPGAKLLVRTAFDTVTKEIDVLSLLSDDADAFDVGSFDVSYDGSKMVFAARGPYNPQITDDADQPAQWRLYEYDFKSGRAYSILSGDSRATDHDITPIYLSDGRIMFASTRQVGAGQVMRNEGKAAYQYQVETNDSDARFGPAFGLHVAEFDSNRLLTAVRQVTFNQSHDFSPAITADGKIVFSRWDAGYHFSDQRAMVRSRRDKVSLYRMNPDGSGLEVLFGYHSQGSVASGMKALYTRAQVSPYENELSVFPSLITATNAVSEQRALLALDVNNFSDVGVSIQNGVTPGNGIIRNTALNYTQQDTQQIPEEGRYSAIAPLFDGSDRSLVSWSFCRLQEPDGTIKSCNGVDLTTPGLKEAPPNYGFWLFDFKRNTQVPLLLPEGNTSPYLQVAVARPRTAPELIPDIRPVIGSVNDVPCEPGFFSSDGGEGILHIRSIYDVDGAFQGKGLPSSVTALDQVVTDNNVPLSQRQARFVRFERPVYIIDPMEKAVSSRYRAVGGPYMNDILGYAPIHPDGSVKVRVPSNVPMTLSIVDAQGRRLTGVSRHLTNISVRDGEVKTCNGCHTPTSTTPHGRLDALPDSINSGAFASAFFADTQASAYQTTPTASGSTTTCYPNAGETMAEVAARVHPTAVALSPDLRITDSWFGEAQAAVNVNYTNLRKAYNESVGIGDTWPGILPFNRADCEFTWDPFCRISFNYETHIQPIWERTRTVDEAGVSASRSCVGCHSDNAAAGELSLERTAVAGMMNSIRDITRNDPVTLTIGGVSVSALNLNALDVNGDVIPELQKQGSGQGYCYRMPDNSLVRASIVPKQEDVVNPQTGETETQIVRDGAGDPVPATFTIRERDAGYSARLLRGSSRSSERFRLLFEPNYQKSTYDCMTGRFTATTAITYDHSAAGLMTDIELKMIWEWLDSGAGYFNNPFDVD